MNFILAKSGNAWLRHLKKTPRESAFSRVPRNTRWFRFHTALLLKLFSTGRRPVCARGRPPMSLQFPIRLFFPLSFPFQSPNLHHLFSIHGPWKSNKNPFSNPPFSNPFSLPFSFYIERRSTGRNIRWIRGNQVDSFEKGRKVAVRGKLICISVCRIIQLLLSRRIVG